MNRGNIFRDEEETATMKETKEVEHLQEQEASKINKHLVTDNKTVFKDNKFDEMNTIQERIKELELSIASLDNDLERFDIERIKHKTRQVVKRMSKVLGQTENNEVQEILKVKTVNGFMKDNILWGKYMVTENSKL